MHATRKNYVPAAGRDWLLPFYDPFTKFLQVEESHRRLIKQAAIAPGQRVLEIGCGTGNLTLLAQKLHPGAQMVGIDPDPKALARARDKAQRLGAAIRFNAAFAEDLPFPEASFDRVLSAFMLHHVKPEAKPLALREALRVLKPGGSLHLVDFAETEPASRVLHGFLASKFHARHGSSDQHLVLGLMRDAGFADYHEVAHQTLVLGQIAYYKAVRPTSPRPAAGEEAT